MTQTRKLLLAFAAASLVSLHWQCSKSPGTDTPETPTLRVSPVSADEGTGSGNTSFSFECTLSQSTTVPVSVTIATENGDAIAGDDYVALAGQTVSFNPGETKKTFTVQVIADAFKERTEEFKVQVSNAVNCSIINPTVKGYIQNDDSQFKVDDAGYSTPNTYPGYTLVWSDEFDGAALNTSDWNFEVGDGCPNCGWGNNELQWYTQGNNLYMQNGKMIIEARQQTESGKNYTSSRITTQRKKTFQYGRIDVRAKLPYGQGIWPAIWMLGANITTVSWPACGELDIMELLGHEPNKVYATAHYGSTGAAQNISRSVVKTNSFADAYHVYSMVWVEDKVRFLVDEELINEVKKSDLGPASYPYNAPFFFILNIAVGGNWPGSPNATTVFPQWMFVDYVRVFQ